VLEPDALCIEAAAVIGDGKLNAAGEIRKDDLAGRRPGMFDDVVEKLLRNSIHSNLCLGA
jgi:hypothetical protein